MKKEKKVAVFKVAGTPTVRGRHKHSASNWKKREGRRTGEKKFLFRIIGRKVRNHFCDLICFRIIGLKIRNHLFDFLFL